VHSEAIACADFSLSGEPLDVEKNMRIVLALLAVLLILAGLLIVLVGVIAVLDPVGTKLADDNDPFGPPPPRWQGAVATIVGLGVISTGIGAVVAMVRRERRLAV
jgi:hypothetical protein